MQNSAEGIAQAIWENLQKMGFYPITDCQGTTQKITQALKNGEPAWLILGQREEEINEGPLDGSVVSSELILEVKSPGLKAVLRPFINYEEASLPRRNLAKIEATLLKNQGQRQKEVPIAIISRPNKKVRYWAVTAGPNAIPCPQKIINLGRQKLVINPGQQEKVEAELKNVQKNR